MDLITWIGSVNAEPISSIIGLPIILILIGILVLKGFALYKAARLQEKGFFWAILIINSMGILPAIYLYLRRKK